MTRIISFIAALILCLSFFPSAVTAAEVSPASSAEPAEIDINSINFPDDNFRRFILDQGYDRNSDLKLSVAELADVTKMDCEGGLNDGHKIGDLSGIGHFRFLTKLNCRDNLLKELDVSELHDLIYLDCSSNMISSLDVSRNTELETLLCGDNSMVSLRASGCYSLLSLDCSGNGLNALDISNCNQLNDLLCQSNDLAVLDVTTVPLIRNYILTTPRVDSGPYVAYGEYVIAGDGADTGRAGTCYHVEMDPETTPYSNDTGRRFDTGINADPFLITTIIFAYILTGRFKGRKNDEWYER